MGVLSCNLYHSALATTLPRVHYIMGTGGYFPGVKRPEREAGHSKTSAQVKNKRWPTHPLPPYVIME
jgi:hypothetical protein